MAHEIAKTIVSSRTSVPTPGEAVRSRTDSVSIFRIDVSADIGNADPVVIGNSDVVAAEGSQKGAVLIPGNQAKTIYIDDLNKLYVDAITADDAVVYTHYRHH